MAHAAVLLIALLLSGYASLDRNLPAGLNLRLGAVNAEGLTIGEGGTAGTVSLGRAGTIVKPAAVPDAAVRPHTAIVYVVQPGQNLAAVAAKFNISQSSIRWSNFANLHSLGADVSAGQTILIPPVEGLVVIPSTGDSPQSLAAKYHTDPLGIIDFNYLTNDNPSLPLTAGAAVVIPGGRGLDFDKVVISNSRSSSRYTGGALSGGAVSWSPHSGNRFAFGYCTWYVYNRKPVPWLGNAIAWYSQAIAYGWKVGPTPAVGAIMVTRESGWGHVAYVESVNANGSWTVSEMNYVAWDRVDSRTISPGQVPLVGFIYGP